MQDTPSNSSQTHSSSTPTIPLSPSFSSSEYSSNFNGESGLSLTSTTGEQKETKDSIAEVNRQEQAKNLLIEIHSKITTHAQATHNGTIGFELNGGGVEIKGFSSRFAQNAALVYNQTKDIASPTVSTPLLNKDYLKEVKEIAEQLRPNINTTIGFFCTKAGAREKSTAKLYEEIIDKIDKSNLISNGRP